MIIQFDSPNASPLTRLAKTQGGLRLACDYQCVNPCTLTDVFLLCTIDEMIRKEGQGRTIFAFYYNISVNVPPRHWNVFFVCAVYFPDEENVVNSCVFSVAP